MVALSTGRSSKKPARHREHRAPHVPPGRRGLEKYIDTGSIAFQARGLGVRSANGRSLLRDVTFRLEERSFLAGRRSVRSGKSTLLGALTGQRPADSGQVRYAGRDLYAAYDELRQRIGLVPQDDILHPQLTVRRALRYAAELRFPADTAREERHRRVER